jgi:hypothetical protein
MIIPERLIRYQRIHDESPEDVCILTYELSPSELKKINIDLGFEAVSKPDFTITTNYKNNSTITFSVNTKKYIEHIATKTVFSSENKELIKSAANASELLEKLNTAQLNDAEKAEYEKIKTELNKDKASWSDIFSRYIYFKYIQPNIPKFLYFDDNICYQGN